jgi:POT family proton-dependent oligopeptide transporter
MSANLSSIIDTDLKQPRGLYLLFFIELWERFGYFAVQALLILYLTKQFLFTDVHAYALFGAFTSLIYATPIIGGYLADRFLGFRKAIILGGILYLFSYFGLASLNRHIFYLSLAGLICGNGFFKANVSSLLGTLYRIKDSRRDSGFTIFYMGINLGGVLAGISCSWAVAKFGWEYGFGLAGLGMIICLIACLLGFKQLGEHGLPHNPQQLTKKIILGLSIQNLIYLGTVILLGSISVEYINCFWYYIICFITNYGYF